MAIHPLTPLTEDEFRATAAILRRDQGLDGSWRFAGIELAEPAKTLVKAWKAGDAVERSALAVLWNRESNEAAEAVVDLTGDAVTSWTIVPGATPNFTVDEWHDIDVAMKSHPDVRAALAERGITDMDLVLFDAWTYAKALMPPQYADRRLGWCDIWVRKTPNGSPYAHPVPGMKLIVDMNTSELLDIERGPDPGMPEVKGEYVPAEWGGEQRTDIAPLQIVQPEGVSFTLDGEELRWQKWSMRVGFNYREGMTLHAISYDGRDVAHRMSFAEMIVPYRDPSFEHVRRTAYDIGEWGLGFMTTSLELGCDCLGEITYLDATLHDTQGEPFTIGNAICIHEEDNAILWKHVDEHAGAEVRRMRRFVVSFHATVANYEYIVYWRFYQDGNIECEVRATGIMVTTPYDAEAGAPRTGTRVDNTTYAPIHQHFIVARLDLDVDGPTQTVLEVDSEVVPVGPDNPHGLAVRTVATPVRSEAESGRDFSWERQRGWKVINPNATNAHGDHPAYKLVPSASIPSLMEPGTPQFERAPVIGHTVWVTANHPEERWPAGAYPTQSTTDVRGMSEWVADDEPLEDADVVLWYVFGIHHVPRPEDWPVMPADTVAWWLKPFGFFDENPSLDVPPSPKMSGSCCADGECTCSH
ncbi:primary-amine oxidase [Nocardioides currus]|uniref:Amine oxidase n=1 Tax=Nocardioides currus TaxID=2133958 RepID=A0A2R7YV39_9ACTN|nr:primary-amine oxidase [Nocardioides currus]PUA80235.1 tyramine oxidase [Nocardioides currus]